MTEDLLEHAHVHLARLVHQRCCRVAQLMYRVMLGTKPCQIEIFIYRILNGLDADALTALTQKQRLVGVFGILFLHTDLHVLRKRGAARLVEIDNALLVALTNHAQGAVFTVKIGQADARKLGNTHTAVEKQRDHAPVAHAVGGCGIAFDGIQQHAAFLQGEVLGQSLFLFGRFNVKGGIGLQQMPFDGQILVKRLDSRELARLSRTCVSAYRAGVYQKFVNAIGGNALDVIKIHRADINFFKILAVHADFFLSGDQPAEKGTQIRQVFADRFVRAALNDRLVRCKIAYDGRELLYIYRVSQVESPHFF